MNRQGRRASEEAIGLAQAILGEEEQHSLDDEEYAASLIVSAREGAERLGISPVTILSWVTRKHLMPADIEQPPIGRPRFLFYLPELAYALLHGHGYEEEG